MKIIQGQKVVEHHFNTVVVGSGAAGMSCAKKLCEYAEQKGITDARERFAVVTSGISLGASRMSGSDKQTYYKMGTSPDTPDSADSFASSLTAGGCCHGDLALAEGIGSLRGFYSLVDAGVPFPSDRMGSYVGYKTDHDPYERATSAGPKTSKMMSECLEKIVRRCGVAIFDHHEAVELLTSGIGDAKRIVGVVTLDRKAMSDDSFALNVFYCENLVLAAGGPGEIYETSVYPRGQTGIHGIAFRAGLPGENLAESQFGLASIKFRWNVSGTYMQAIPRIFSTDSEGNDPRELLVPFFPTMSGMATNIFLKGYQWPFDPQRIEDHQSSLIDIIVSNETQSGRRVFMDFLSNPVGSDGMDAFAIEDLVGEARSYLEDAGATQDLPIERLRHMNPLAIDIYAEHGIDITKEPLEIAVCAQHNNGGFAVDIWWQSGIKRTFVIGEMAGTHGVKRPGGSALNGGQVGAQRAAEHIVNACSCEVPSTGDQHDHQLEVVIMSVKKLGNPLSAVTPDEVITGIQHTMTRYGGHVRSLNGAAQALREAVDLCDRICRDGFKTDEPRGITAAIRARHLALASCAYLKGILELIRAGSGSRGSHLVLSEDGTGIHPDIKDPETGEALKFLRENEELRESVIRIRFDADSEDLFRSETVAVRPAPRDRKAFELAWADYRSGSIYG